MIIALTGTPGSGKTYDAVRKIINNLMMGRVIFTNVEGMDDPLCLEMIKVVTGLSDCALADHLHFFEEEQLADFWNHVVPGAMIVLDEVQNIFSSREWQSKKNLGFNTWASTHRHNGFDVFLITQHIMRLDTSVRALIEWTYIYRKVNFFGAAVKKKYMRHAYGGDEIRGSALGKNIRTYQDHIFRCYKSYVASDVKEIGVMKHVNVLKHPIFYAIPLIFSAFLYFFLQSGFVNGDLFGNKSITESHAARQDEKVKPSSSAGPSLSTYSEHTPNIYKSARNGQILFSNRLQSSPIPETEEKE